jgi:hypothetical protein
MLKKIPKTLKVLGKTWRIRVVSPQAMQTQGAIGEAHFDARIILLSNELKGEILRTTFYHEAVHALQWESGLTQAMSREMSEVMADLVARLIDDNF